MDLASKSFCPWKKKVKKVYFFQQATKNCPPGKKEEEKRGQLNPLFPCGKESEVPPLSKKREGLPPPLPSPRCLPAHDRTDKGGGGGREKRRDLNLQQLFFRAHTHTHTQLREAKTFFLLLSSQPRSHTKALASLPPLLSYLTNKAGLFLQKKAASSGGFGARIIFSTIHHR